MSQAVKRIDVCIGLARCVWGHRGPCQRRLSLLRATAEWDELLEAAHSSPGGDLVGPDAGRRTRSFGRTVSPSAGEFRGGPVGIAKGELDEVRESEAERGNQDRIDPP